jgi:hypothetical protein
MKESIFETLEDEKGNIDFRRAGGMSKRNVLRQFESILTREAKRQSNSEFSKQVWFYARSHIRRWFLRALHPGAHNSLSWVKYQCAHDIALLVWVISHTSNAEHAGINEDLSFQMQY